MIKSAKWEKRIDIPRLFPAAFAMSGAKYSMVKIPDSALVFLDVLAETIIKGFRN